MALTRKSQTKVGLDAKISMTDLHTLPYDGTVDIIEGAPVRYGPTGQAAAALGGATGAATAAARLQTLYINFVDSGRVDVIDSQGDPFSQDNPPTLDMASTGTLTGIRGSGINIGLPAECWTDGALPAVGTAVFVGAGGLFDTEAPIAAGAYHGVIDYIREGRAYFHFTSTAITLA